jgi:hypothetical protein
MTWGPFAWWFDLIKQGKIDPQPDEDPREDRGTTVDELTGTLTDPKPWKLRSVGAWVGWGTFGSNSSMERDLKFARQLGLGRLNVICNDHSTARAPRGFDTYNKSRISMFCRRAVDEGFSVHLMSWWMPHESYIREGAEQLRMMASDSGAQSVELDAEEPWTRAQDPMPWAEAAELTASELGDLPFGVTGIGYTPKNKVGPLVAKASYMVPQCYATGNNDLDPATAPPHLCRRWQSAFGERELVVGLAAYKQQRAGYTKEKFMTQAFHAAESMHPTDIVYWSLRHIRASRTTANIVRKLCQRAEHRAGV